MIMGKQVPTGLDTQYQDSFNLLFNQIEDYLFILDPTGKIIRTNKAALEKLEYTLEEMINMNFELLYPLTRRMEVQGKVKGMLEGNIARCLIPLRTKSGQLIPLEIRMFEGKLEGEKVFYGIGKDVFRCERDEGLTIDITTRKVEEGNQKLKDIQSILDSLPCIAWMKDKRGKYVIINRAFEDFYRVKAIEIVGKTDFDIFPYKIALKHKGSEEELIKSGNRLNPLHHEVSGKWLETFVALFFKDNGKVAGTLGVARNITERKKLEKKLREQAEYAELLFRTVPSAVLSVDRHGKIIRWNNIAEEITGYTVAEVMGKECSRILHGVGRDECGLCHKIIDSPLINEKCKIVTKDGQIRHVLKSVAVLKDEFGEISEKMECFEDITEMTDLEVELRESKERYAAIVNNAPLIVVIFKQGVIEFVNDAGKEVLGYKDESIGRHMKDLMTEDSLVCVDSALIAGEPGEHCLSCEIELIKKSGEIINVLLKGTEITYEREKAFLAVMMDITEGKQLNAKLRASEEKFRQLAETINEIFLITDMDKIVYVSPAYERISGMSSQSLLDNQRSLLELIHPADRERMQASFCQGFEMMNEATNAEFRIIRPDGEMRWLWLQSYPVRDEANNSPLKAISIVDITDRKKIEDKLWEREQQTQMELLLAAQVQQDSLPHPFIGDRVRVSTIFEPHSIVSGDFFNFKWFEGQNKLCGYIVDVSGHGVATALQTATFKMMLDNVLLTGETIEEGALQIINQRITPYLYEDSFVALLYFEFDLQAAKLKLISAGITLFLVAKPNECSLVPISGCYLGIIDDPAIEMVTIPLKVGEIYCMMSDGASDLIELCGIRKQRCFTEYEKWLAKLAESPERNDDFSVICIEILAESGEISVLDIKTEEDLEHAQLVISEFLEMNSLRHASTLEVAINEAMNNGFYYGGHARIKIRRMGGKLIIRVKDDGLGFNTERVTVQLKEDMYDMEFDELLEVEGGRGILLMRLFCDKVIYNAKGNEVLLMKKV
ncbi:MAG: PAS domain S-box protein [Desulfosporosinus sp.]|nr:PAS domain S-box protein [Desulfosporosinus sp.]